MTKGQAVLVVLVCASLVIARTAWAAQHVVGGSSGWDPSTDFDSWASGQTFKVGDQLVFKYSGLHSVVELGSEAAYKNCDLGTPVNSMNSGNDAVKLTKPGTRYFTCGTAGHCDQGMKLKVNVVSDGAASSSSPPPPDSDSGSDLGVSFGFGLVFGLIATGLVGDF